MAISLRALSAAGAVLVLTACGTTPPPAVSVSPTTDSASPGVSASPSGSVSAPASTMSASPTGSASGTPTASTALVLEAKGLPGANFGTPEDDVTALLTARAGKPDDSYSGPVCELDDATPYGRQLAYGGAAFLFQSKAKGTKKSPRSFTSWVVNLDEGVKSSMKLPDGYPADTTFAKLKTVFPKGKQSTIALGESAVYVFRTPSGIWYRGDDKKTPNAIGSGPMGTCE
ncbi:MAG: hypothetical protein QM582_18075 [Micropruina sp.]|uniref:hypothetical protein n=1 Tax=Micropruina sp. TaxID=2737536 RepID=UPI0039E3F0FB